MNASSARLLLGAAVLGGLSVLAGTFGAHGLAGRLAPDLLEIWETGVHYGMVHALAALLAALLAGTAPRPRAALVAGWLFAAGVVVFSGSLFVLALTGQRWLGMITPIGGTAFIAGWAALVVAAVRRT